MRSILKSKKGENDMFKNLVVGLVLVSLFAFGFMYWMVEVGNGYGYGQSDILIEPLQYESFETSLSGVSGNATSAETSFINASGTIDVEGGISGRAIFSVGKTIASFLTFPFRILGDLAGTLFHAPRWLVLTINGLFTIIVVLAIWRLIRVGD